MTPLLVDPVAATLSAADSSHVDASPFGRLGLTVVDFFCGIGGSTQGLVEAGYTVVLAANHSLRAIETHSTNHPDTEHLCADISNIDLRGLPKADVLWASPICTELSPAGGRRRKGPLDRFEKYGSVRQETFERTRVTFWEVVRAAELFRYKAVLVENVVEAASWELFDCWLACMTSLGYNHQFVSVSAAHISGENNEAAPQWRDRRYIVFTRTDIPLPDLEPRPRAYCAACGHDVDALQSWKNPDGRRIGKYRTQYVYVCPNIGCHDVVEPYVVPAAAAIDLSDMGTRIGDRKRPLARATIRRLQVGLETITWPALENAAEQPEPFLTMLRRNGTSSGIHSAPAATFTSGGTRGGFHHGLTIPPGAFFSKHHGGLDYKRIEHMNKSVHEPFGSLGGKVNTSVVIPYRKGSKPHRVDLDALTTMATREAHGLLQAAIKLEDCHFRMLRPREAATSQRFPRSYVLTGNQGEQQLGAGNAVSVNVAHWIGRQLCEVLA